MTLHVTTPNGGEITLPRSFCDLEEALDFARATTTGPWRVTDGEGRTVADGYAKRVYAQ